MGSLKIIQLNLYRKIREYTSFVLFFSAIHSEVKSDRRHQQFSSSRRKRRSWHTLNHGSDLPRDCHVSCEADRYRAAVGEDPFDTFQDAVRMASKMPSVFRWFDVNSSLVTCRMLGLISSRSQISHSTPALRIKTRKGPFAGKIPLLNGLALGADDVDSDEIYSSYLIGYLSPA